LSAKEKDNKKKEDLKSFTVGSVPPSGPKAKKGPKAPKLDVSEKDFPFLAGLVRGNNAKPFQDEMMRVLGVVHANGEKGGPDDKATAEKVEKAYAMALAIVENAKVVR
jgi:hypothetical protein